MTFQKMIKNNKFNKKKLYNRRKITYNNKTITNK